MNPRTYLYPAFVLSGVAGLVYEVLWGRYLGVYVGHSAYAQVLVLTVYLGGMAVGAIAIGERSKRLADPLLWYAWAEAALAVFGVVFHGVFTLLVDVSYDHLFPAIGSAGLVGAVRWGLASAVIMPQAILLGTTFPLMAAGLVRRDSLRPGRGVATVYLLNTLGGSAGVLLAGFWLITRFGFATTSMVAAGLNVVAAGLVWAALANSREARSSPVAAVVVDDSVGARDLEQTDGNTPDPTSLAQGSTQRWAENPRALATGMLVVSFFTAVASFAYEIGWIRMLSLLLGSATHAFELMLSAFILGLAVGAWLIRGVVDRSADPRRLLGTIQVLMGVAAIATIPVYMASFSAMASLVNGYSADPAGYLLFNIGRYALCLAVMLPATALAGTTLPVIVGMLLRAGVGEQSIARVYAVNTVGSVVGVALAGLIALPLLGLKGLLVAGAVLDMALGVWVLTLAARSSAVKPITPYLAAAAAAMVTVTISFAFPLSEFALTSGVYRYARVPDASDWEPLYYRDGRTATISAHVGREDGRLVISTNGKPDASMGRRWYVAGRDTLPVTAVEPGRDFMTQVLAPLVGLAHAPGARSIANVGHGSGMTGTTLLSGAAVERLVTIEIEPAIVEGSSVFLPANEAVFTDPRSTFAFDDAKSFFAYSQERFDVIFLEPSNPWVSGVASLFTAEFYARARDFLSEQGVLVQWMQMYELDDDLFMTVLAAVDGAFDAYRVYRVGDMDVAIIAAKGAELPSPDWSVLESESLARITLGSPPLRPEAMAALQMFDHTTFRSLLDRGERPNSDYHPLLDAGAERARMAGTTAYGLHSFSANRMDLHRLIAEQVQEPIRYVLPSSRGVRPFTDWGRAAWMRESLEEGGGAPPVQFPAWSDALLNVRNFLLEVRESSPSGGWQIFASEFGRVERELNWGTTGWVNASLYDPVYAFLDREDAPDQARAVVDFHHGLASFDWEKSAAAADVLVGRVSSGESWVRPTVLLDGAVVAYLKSGRAASARRAMNLLSPRTQRQPRNLRDRLLHALIDEALAAN